MAKSKKFDVTEGFKGAKTIAQGKIKGAKKLGKITG